MSKKWKKIDCFLKFVLVIILILSVYNRLIFEMNKKDMCKCIKFFKESFINILKNEILYRWFVFNVEIKEKILNKWFIIYKGKKV